MCDPASATAAGLSAAQFSIGALGANAEYNAAQQQAQQVNQNSYLSALFNNMALVQTYSALDRERLDQRNALSGELFKDRIEVAKAKGTAVTAAGQAGVDGSASVAALMQDYAAKSGRAAGSIRQNYDMIKANTVAQQQAAYTGTRARNNALPKVVTPDYGSTLLRIAGTGVSALSGLIANRSVSKKLFQTEDSY